MTYLKSVFNPSNLQHAMEIVLTPDSSDPRKFENETSFLVKFLADQWIVRDGTRVLDFGCGMGRIARPLLSLFDCEIVGLDLSTKMLEHARVYCGNNPKFHPMREYSAQDIDVVICAFTLQHVENPEREVRNIHRVLKPEGRLVLLDTHKRYVPVAEKIIRQGDVSYMTWENDGINVRAIIEKYFASQVIYDYLGHPFLSTWLPKLRYG